MLFLVGFKKKNRLINGQTLDGAPKNINVDLVNLSFARQWCLIG